MHFLTEETIVGFRKLEAPHWDEIYNSASGCVPAHRLSSESGKKKLFGGTIFIPHLDKARWAHSICLEPSNTLRSRQSEFKSLVELEVKVAVPQDKPLFV